MRNRWRMADLFAHRRAYSSRLRYKCLPLFAFTTNVESAADGTLDASRVQTFMLLDNVIGIFCERSVLNASCTSYQTIATLSRNSYGVSVTTLEEVFLKVANDSSDHKNLGHLEQIRRESSASAMNVSTSKDAVMDQVSRCCFWWLGR